MSISSLFREIEQRIVEGLEGEFRIWIVSVSLVPFFVEVSEGMII